MSWTIRAEDPGDAPAIEALTELCFGPGRYAKSAYRLREGVAPVAGLSFVAFEEGTLRGAVRFWPVVIGTVPALMLGPLVVQPEQRGRGIGIELMQTGLTAARAGGHLLVILVGDEPYYARVGFARVPRGQMNFPGPVDPARLLSLELVPGTLARARGPVLRLPPEDRVAASGAPVVLAPASAPLDPPGP